MHWIYDLGLIAFGASLGTLFGWVMCGMFGRNREDELLGALYAVWLRFGGDMPADEREAILAVMEG